MHPGEGACRNAYTKANASFTDAEEQKAWKREAGFDRTEIITEMREQHFLAGFDSERFHSKLYNPRWPHTPEKHTLEMRVNVERLRMVIVLSQPAPPPHCGSSPRRLPAVSTGLNESGAPRAENQPTEREENFPLEASLDVFLHVCTSPA